MLLIFFFLSLEQHAHTLLLSLKKKQLKLL